MLLLCIRTTGVLITFQHMCLTEYLINTSLSYDNTISVSTLYSRFIILLTVYHTTSWRTSRAKDTGSSPSRNRVFDSSSGATGKLLILQPTMRYKKLLNFNTLEQIRGSTSLRTVFHCLLNQYLFIITKFCCSNNTFNVHT